MLLEVTIFYEINAQVNSTVQRKSRLVKEIADIISEMSGIGFYWKSLEQKSVNCSNPVLKIMTCSSTFLEYSLAVLDEIAAT